jgi:hypothetical protein
VVFEERHDAIVEEIGGAAQLRLGKNGAFLGHLGFERLQPLPEIRWPCFESSLGTRCCPQAGCSSARRTTWASRSAASRLRRFGLRRLISRRAVAHDRAGLRHIPELLRQIEDPDLGLDDVLLSRHSPPRRLSDHILTSAKRAMAGWSSTRGQSSRREHPRPPRRVDVIRVPVGIRAIRALLESV